MALNRLRSIVGSRWLLVPAALMAGAAAGALLTFNYYQRQKSEEVRFDAALLADNLAQLDLNNAGSLQNLRDLTRTRLQTALDSLAQNAQLRGINTAELDSHNLRTVSTYLSHSGPIRLSPTATKMLKAFPPYPDDEVIERQCRSGICELVKHQAGHAATRPGAGP